MKILLINPPRENEIIGNNPTIIEEERGHNPPLGLLYIAAYLQKHTHHEVAVIDAQVEELSYESLKERIRSIHPDVVGITAMTMTLIDVLKTVAIVNELDTNTKVVLGGPHVHLFPEETINLPGVDYLVLGEGEEAFKDLLDHIDDKARLRTLPGFVFKDGDDYVHTGMRQPIEYLDKLPFPARELVPYKKYSSLLARSNCVTTIFTSRGCPFRCSFCDRAQLGREFRARSAKSVADELEECVRMGITEFLFYDDTFTVNKQRTIDISEDIVRRKLDIGWDIRTRVDAVNEEVIKCLAKAGCQGIHYGIEAGTERILKVLNKGIHLDKAEETFNLTRKYGIPILAYFMIGNPGETTDDIYTTFELAKRLNPDYLHMTIFTPFPGTNIYLDGLKSGEIKRNYWREFARNPVPEFIPPHWDGIFTREELADMLAEGYKRFYLRPTYIVKRLMRLRSWSEFKKNALAGTKVLFMR